MEGPHFAFRIIASAARIAGALSSYRLILRNRMVPLLTCGALVSLAIITGTALILLDLHGKAVRDNERVLQNVSYVLAAETDRAFQSLQIVQASLIKEMQVAGVTSEPAYETWAAHHSVYEELRSRIAPLPYVDAVTMINSHGKLLNFSRYWPIPNVNISDRDYYKALSKHPRKDIFISRPVRNRGTKTWTIYLAHSFSDPHDRFLGLVLGAMQLGYFEQFYSRIKLGPGSAISLYRRDGVMLARFPASGARIGEAFGEAPVFQMVLRDHLAGIHQGRSPVDGKDRFVAATTLPDYPMVMIVSRTTRTALSGWYHQALYMGFGALLLEIVIAGIVLLGMRQIRTRELVAQAKESQAEAEHARRLVEADLQVIEEKSRREQELYKQYLRFGIALDNMAQALCMFDTERRLVVANEQFAALFGVIPVDLIPGETLDALMAKAVRGEKESGQPAGDLWKRLLGVVDLDVTTSLLWDMQNGRTLSVLVQPMETGGWLATFEDVTERRAAEARILHMAHHDALTGLCNRVRFHEEMSRAITRVSRGETFAVLYLDLDHFKDVNDTLGHPAGDALLQLVTQRLIGCVRSIDTVARLGGDEFAILQSDAAAAADTIALAQRVIEELRRAFEINGHHLVVGTSIGIAVAPQDGADPDTLLKNADLALYRAKRDGRGLYRFFEPGMDARIQARRAMEIDLRRALAAEEFEVFYQMIVDLRSNEPVGAEALIRWRHPERGLVAPGMFVPLAEEIGLIVAIGEWVLHRACADAAKWPTRMRLAVNLSPVQFKTGTLAETVGAALNISGLQPDRLELEITETVMLQDTEMTLQTLHQLRNLGVRISLDDFGTGYSSLSYLQKFPFDKIKIDRSFVMGLGRSDNSAAIVRAVAGIGRNLGIRTTAEGIETTAQKELALIEGCTEGQGYLFSKPCAEAEFKRLLNCGNAVIAAE